MASPKDTVAHLLSFADIKINGSRPFDIQVKNERLYRRVLGNPQLGLGESYMDGWWDVQRLDQLAAKLFSADIQSKVRTSPGIIKTVVISSLLNRQTIRRAKNNASRHYDIGNDLYERMLDKNMIYSCAYWKNATNLDDAQDAKLELICQKLYLKKGMSLLDVGCGWGGFAVYAAKNYGVKVTGITPAKEQVKLARERTKSLPVTILQKDYREIDGKFDRIVSIGMLEHVGPKNYKVFFEHCEKMLNDSGIMLHHTIGNNHSANKTDPWIDKYIFPGGVIPSLAQITRAIEDKLVIEDIHNFGPYYDKTLMAWHKNFVKSYPQLKDKYDARFYRMWNFYLLTCAGLFRIRRMQLWQIVMRKIETSDTYKTFR
ncbi:MAG: cyclopropane fatty acyl phospholipid synthase [Candidatus Saccharimonadales bacterium]|jgi:cyclopropane-fatty-acyl-phospholipid synthase